MYKIKSGDVKENKIREFNFKVFHGILPCNYRLKKWKIKDCDKCDVCAEVQTIRHLLFDCKYSKPVWGVIESIIEKDITYMDVLCGLCGVGNGLKNYINLCAFIIFKEWLIFSLKNQQRPNICNLSYFENEICFRFELYHKANLFRM